MRKPPKLSYRPRRGYWHVTYRGKETYLGRDESAAQERYLSWIRDVWSPSQSLLAEYRKNREASKHTISVQDLRERFTDAIERERGAKLAADYRSYLKHLSPLDPTPAGHLRPVTLEGVKKALQAKDLSPVTVNHILGCTKSMLRWAARHDLLPPMDLSSVRQVRVPKKMVAVPGVEDVLALIQKAGEKDHRLVPWLSLNYLACMRPSEVARLVHRDFQWFDEGVACMQGKSTWKREEFRYIVLSDEALGWLERAEPHWKTWQAYSRRAGNLCDLQGTRFLRSWGATHLRRLRVSRGDIERILGHSSATRPLWEYMEEDLHQLREAVSLLSLQRPSDRLYRVRGSRP